MESGDYGLNLTKAAARAGGLESTPNGAPVGILVPGGARAVLRNLTKNEALTKGGSRGKGRVGDLACRIRMVGDGTLTKA